MLLPKDYVRFRLTGERAIDAADASGTLLFDVGEPPLVRGGLRRARDAARVAAAGARVDRDRAARATRPRPRSASGSTGPGPCRSCSGRRASSSPSLPAYAPDREARVHVFCHAVPGDVARDGRDAVGRRLVRVAARRARRAGRRARRRGRRAGSRGRRGCSSRRTCRASARRTPTPTRAEPSPGSRCGTTAARSRGR